MTHNDSLSKPIISIAKLEYLLNCLSTASPRQQKKLFDEFNTAFPDVILTTDELIEIIKISIALAQQMLAQEHNP